MRHLDNVQYQYLYYVCFYIIIIYTYLSISGDMFIVKEKNNIDIKVWENLFEARSVMEVRLKMLGKPIKKTTCI